MSFLSPRSKFVLLTFLVGVCVRPMMAQPSERAPSGVNEKTYVQRAGLAAKSLQKWYDLQSGLYKTTGWWNAANVITVLADYSKAVPSHDYDSYSPTPSPLRRRSPQGSSISTTTMKAGGHLPG
jgi:hypothetical protein